MTRIALITGANKGIGFETARRLQDNGVTVLIAARSPERGREAAEKLGARHVPLDVTDEGSVASAAKWVEQEYGVLDILVNNAGIGGAWAAASATQLDAVREVFETNVFGVIAVTNAMLPLLRRSRAARIVNVSSRLGSLRLMGDRGSELWPTEAMAYPASKTALNMVTVQYAKELHQTPIKVNMVCPGHTATDLNNHQGHRTAAQGAAISVTMALLPDDGPTGTFVSDEGPIPL
jgi:NAD(P)-dependent dehydrogenase (short-subunit alcohol dehydrogenase family)